MGEDQGIYNAIVVALIIGIIVVIATLLFQKPQPESFTELYFNDHKSLPNYVQDNQNFNISFSIANRENKDVNYNYSIKQTLYRWDYTCENPRLYLEESEDTAYATLLETKPDIPTRIASSTDPSLLVRHDEYTISFDYRTLSGAGQVVLRFKDVQSETLYAFVINEQKKEAYFISPLKERYTQAIDITKGDAQRIFINASNHTLILQLNDQIIFNQTDIAKYTSGFPEIELTRTFAQLFNFVIKRKVIKQSVYLNYADQQHQSIDLVSRQSLLGEESLMNIAAVTGKTDFTLQYLAEEPINLTRYSMEYRYRIVEGDKVSVGVQDGYEFFFYPDTNEIALYYPVGKTRMNLSGTVNTTRFNMQNLKLDAYDSHLRVFYNNELVFEVFDAPVLDNIIPVIATYDSHVQMDSLRIISLEYPLNVQYDIPSEVRPRVTYNRVPDVNVFESAKTSDQQKEYVEGLFDKQQINSTEYKISGAYIDPQKNSSVLLTFNDKEKPIYSVEIKNDENAVIVTYQLDGKTKTEKIDVDLTDSIIHDVELEVNNNSLSVILDDKPVFEKNVDKATEGLLFMDHPNTVNIPRLEVNKKDTNEVSIHRTIQTICRPMPVREYETNETYFISQDDQQEFESSVRFEDDFDIAKVEVGLDSGQEIHFWVTRT